MKKILFLALAATTLFACNKENGESPDNEGTKTVTLTIESVERVGSKAVEDAGTAHETPVADFTVYFINSSGGVVETRTTATSSSGSSYVFDGVSGLASKLFIVANTSLTSTTLTGSTLAELKANVLAVKNYQTGIDNVIMAPADASNITATAGQEGKYEATVTIAPVVARLEIAKLTAIAAGGPLEQDVKDFTVKNIYINAYDPNMPLIGTASGRTTGTTANFETTDLKDVNIDIVSTDKVVVPAGLNAVWAYQLFPGSAPTMVVQFSSITFENGTAITDKTNPADELCITVTGFNPNTFAAAKIYNVTNIEFSSKNIGKPYEATKNISVTLSVTPWAINATTVTLQ